MRMAGAWRGGISGVTSSPVSEMRYASVRAKFLPPSPGTADTGVRRMTITTRDVDREGDIVDPGGCDYQAYMAKNPIVLFAHDYTGGAGAASPTIVGRTRSLSIGTYDIQSEYEFAPTPFAQQVRELVDRGLLNSASVGFRSL